MIDRLDFLAWATNLNSRLEEFASGYTSASPEDKRLAMVGICGVLSIELARLPGLDRQNILPLEDLMLRLDDVTNGKNALAPIKRPKGGRPHDGFRSSINQARAVAAIEFLMAAGSPEDEACAFVAKELTKAGHRGRRSPSISVGTVRDWRTKIHYGDSDPIKADARLIYQRARSDLCEIDPENRMNLRERKRFVASFLGYKGSAAGVILTNP